MTGLRLEENKSQKHARHDRHDHHAEAVKALKDEVIEQNVIKMQNQKLINTINRLLNRRLRALGVSNEELLEVEEQEREREEKIKRGQDDPDRPTEKTQEEIEQEALTLLQDQSISDDVINPPVVKFQGRMLRNDDVATAAIVQFNAGQYDFEPNLMKLPYIPRLGRVGYATEIIRQLVFEFMVQAMKKKFPPDELYDMWISVMETGIIKPEVCEIAEKAINFMADKLTPEEMALTTPAKLAAMIVKAIKEAYCQSKDAERKLEKVTGAIFEDDEDEVKGVGDVPSI